MDCSSPLDPRPSLFFLRNAARDEKNPHRIHAGTLTFAHSLRVLLLLLLLPVQAPPASIALISLYTRLLPQVKERYFVSEGG